MIRAAALLLIAACVRRGELEHMPTVTPNPFRVAVQWQPDAGPYDWATLSTEPWSLLAGHEVAIDAGCAEIWVIAYPFPPERRFVGGFDVLGQHSAMILRQGEAARLLGNGWFIEATSEQSAGALVRLPWECGAEPLGERLRVEPIVGERGLGAHVHQGERFLDVFPGAGPR
jgi:hypothetical protein